MIRVMTEILSANTDHQPVKRRSWFWRVVKWLFGIGLVLGLIAAIILFIFIVKSTRDLPSVESLSEYQPPVMSRVHAGDGKLISEFRKQARVFVPIETVPDDLQLAFVAAEDKRFYTHDGFDPIGFARAMKANVGHVIKGRRLEGGSTLTQQVAKNFLVGNERNVERKIREVAIARRIEKAMDKDTILELYLNEIYFGRGAYGVAAASLNYFGKPMKDLTVDEIAYLAVLPKGPSNYQVGDPEKKARAMRRRNYVLTRMAEDEYITQVEAEVAREKDIIVTKRFEGDEYLAAEYFVEEARKQIYKLYGEDELYEGGLSIRTTLDTSMQLEGRRALRRGLEMMDRRHGYRGPLKRFDSLSDWKTKLAAVKPPRDIGDWRVAAVIEAGDKSAKLGFAPPADLEEDEVFAEIDAKGTLALSDITWAKKALAKGAVGPNLKSVKNVVKAGDVILVQRKRVKAGEAPSTEYNLRQVPKANGGLIAMDPHTGRVLAMIGGYSFDQSQFNRATQAKRQPGSAFKPFVYAAAMKQGFTPADQILDAPFVIERKDVECEENELGALELRGAQEERRENEEDAADEDECERFYKPENYNAGNFYGLSTLRLGIEKSRNAMTVRLANEMGMAPVMSLSKDFGIYDEPMPELAWALGAGETTLLRLATAYSTMINGGKAVEPRILDRVQDGNGKTIFNAFEVDCPDCLQEEYLGGEPPNLLDERAQVIDPITAYQITYIMQGAVQNGTGAKLKALGRPLGGKTGTTNDSFDNWFMGFSPDLVVGVYVGMDTPEQMGRETGSSSAVPIVKDFLETVLKDQAKVPFRIPDGVTLAPVNRVTGEPSYIGAPDYILEAFKPGTEPTVGGLSRTIRVGSGTDSLGGFFGSTIEDDESEGELETPNENGYEDDADLSDDTAAVDEESEGDEGTDTLTDGDADAETANREADNSTAAETVEDTDESTPSLRGPSTGDLESPTNEEVVETVIDTSEGLPEEVAEDARLDTPTSSQPLGQDDPVTSVDPSNTPAEEVEDAVEDAIEKPVEKALDDGLY